MQGQGTVPLCGISWNRLMLDYLDLFRAGVIPLPEKTCPVYGRFETGLLQCLCDVPQRLMLLSPLITIDLMQIQ